MTTEEIREFFEAVERFKQEHPEYERARDIYKRSKAILDDYHKRQPVQPMRIITTSGTAGVRWHPCGSCGGKGHRLDVGGGHRCPTCNGDGGTWIE